MITPVPIDIERYLATARWFAGKGRAFRVSSTRVAVVPGQGPPALVVLAEVDYPDAGDDSELYQLPVSLHREPQDGLEHAWLGQWDDVHAYDAVHDRAAMSAWLEAFVSPGSTGPLHFERSDRTQLDTSQRPALMTADQSNSSVAFGEDTLLKVFRKVTQGGNPDIEIHDLLTRAGSSHVAALHGWVDWRTNDGEVIQLAMLQQFLRTASDGWTLATGSVRSLFAEADLHAHEVGGDFASEAARLGEALAETHATLAAEFPTELLSDAGAQHLADVMLGRLDAAVEAVPALAAYADRLRPLMAAVGDAAGVQAQRIHGDLHLGQTLRTVKGWKLVDFEGEPARPLAERRLPEPVWRDVAGMLRSFDYVSAVVQRELDGDSQTREQRAYRGAEWVEHNRRAFLTAYAGGELSPEQRLLLDAFEADKAVYECAYEIRNRPDWADIPLAAVARLCSQEGHPEGE
ncbi:maltokinase N-terminal cap-like domain-containing protein [Nocardioides jejuensis]|uniref:Maltokinase n=1 Tax=Nocardioides jejuensis TaxID=2502782 RepID=A0A4R1CKV7_9ACTN|nr:hypothetical protein [Nocardioides jejuensis]TCJ31085.1 hypothetical protein EPD65_00480 [Nocardioides jejuensis]